jgi:hypothetical protein
MVYCTAYCMLRNIVQTTVPLHYSIPYCTLFFTTQPTRYPPSCKTAQSSHLPTVQPVLPTSLKYGLLYPPPLLQPGLPSFLRYGLLYPSPQYYSLMYFPLYSTTFCTLSTANCTLFPTTYLPSCRTASLHTDCRICILLHSVKGLKAGDQECLLKIVKIKDRNIS